MKARVEKVYWASFCAGCDVWVLPSLDSFADSRSNLEEVGIASDTHKERFMLRLNSDEMFGTRLYSNLFGLFAWVGFFAFDPQSGSKMAYAGWSIGLLMLLGLFGSDSKGAFLAGLWRFSFVVFLGSVRACRNTLSYLWLLVPLWCWVAWNLFVKDVLQASIQIRLDYWKVAWQMFLKTHMGVGALNFSEHYGHICMQKLLKSK